LFHIWSICRRYNILHVKVDFCCDGLEALKGSVRHETPSTTNISYFDLISTVYKLINDGLFTIFFNHVKGHQDRTLVYLSMWEELNIVVNARVKLAL